MKNGFVKVGCYTPKSKVCDVEYNAKNIIDGINEAASKGVKILVFPELSLTTYTAGDLFYHDVLIESSYKYLGVILEETKFLDILVFLGIPYKYSGRLYNVAVAIKGGNILGLVPKTYLPNYNEFYEKRQFVPAEKEIEEVELCGQKVPFGTKLLFTAEGFEDLKIACEICEDLWVMSPPSVEHAKAGATLIVNLSASNELVGKKEYREKLVSGQSARLYCGYMYADAGAGESTTDMVFSGHNIICENGKILKESNLFTYGLISSEIDIDLLMSERRKFVQYSEADSSYRIVPFNIAREDTKLTRTFPRTPFVPNDEGETNQRAELILQLQSQALAKRIVHTHSNCAVIGISGGLDSALALLVAVRAKKLLPDEQRESFVVYGITMPCFGTTNRTLMNAKKLTRALGAKCLKISIRTAVNRHLSDIKHPKDTFDVTYENAQARERTQVLMDFANQRNGMVVGTGDLSELALGWATYNGDHMSMYGVNGSVPKTLVKYLVRYEAKRYGGVILKTLDDILDTPISPELLPSDGEKIVQVTEDKVGPYELHDFFLYYFVRFSFSPSKIYRIAKQTFMGIYEDETILKWLKVFVKRFFQQQFKRSCIPDGVKIGTVSLSPRGDWRMPSDAVVNEWLKELGE